MELRMPKFGWTEKDKYHIIYICNLKKTDTNKFVYETEIDLWTQKTNLQLPEAKGGPGINQESGINIYTLLYLK